MVKAETGTLLFGHFFSGSMTRAIQPFLFLLTLQFRCAYNDLQLLRHGCCFYCHNLYRGKYVLFALCGWKVYDHLVICECFLFKHLKMLTFFLFGSKASSLSLQVSDLTSLRKKYHAQQKRHWICNWKIHKWII